MKTKQQQKAEARKVYQAKVDLEWGIYQTKCIEIDEQDDIKIIDGERYKLIEEKI